MNIWFARIVDPFIDVLLFVAVLLLAMFATNEQAFKPGSGYRGYVEPIPHAPNDERRAAKVAEPPRMTVL